MSKSSKPKYFATYHGPSYGTWDASEYMMGVASLKEAKDLFRQFHQGWVTYDEYLRSPDGLHVPWRMSEYVSTPATTREDRMEVYAVIEDDVPGRYLMNDDIEYWLTWGPRGGIVVEK